MRFAPRFAIVGVAAVLTFAGCRSAAEPGAPATAGAPPPIASTCAADSDCTASPYLRPVTGVEDCFCPACPAPVSASSAETWRAGWEVACGGNWSLEAGCRKVDCARPPGRPGCREGRCVWKTAEDAP